MSNYGWVIEKDHLDDEAVEIVGPRDIPSNLELRLSRGDGRSFRLYDDDGELYYSGRIVFANATDEVGDNLPEEAFGPLDDYGMPNAGCTEIRYYMSGWKSL